MFIEARLFYFFFAYMRRTTWESDSRYLLICRKPISIMLEYWLTSLFCLCYQEYFQTGEKIAWLSPAYWWLSFAVALRCCLLLVLSPHKCWFVIVLPPLSFLPVCFQTERIRCFSKKEVLWLLSQGCNNPWKPWNTRNFLKPWKSPEYYLKIPRKPVPLLHEPK